MLPDKIQMNNADCSFIMNVLSLSENVYAAVFSSNGTLITGNNAFSELINKYNLINSPSDIFQQPSFSELSKMLPVEESECKTNVTLGSMIEVYLGLKAHVLKRGGLIHFYGEVNTAEMVELNKEYTILTHEIQDLNRKLKKNEVMLNKTLSDLKQTQSMLIQSEKMNALGMLVAGVAHEIRNPLAFVIANFSSLENFVTDIEGIVKDTSDFILETSGEEALEKYKQMLDQDMYAYMINDLKDLKTGSLEGLNRITKIVSDLQRFSRLDEAELKRVNLAQTVESTLVLAMPELKQRSISVSVHLDSPVELDCYPAEFNQALLNLIINAMQAIGENGVINIESVQKEQLMVLKISDTGSGIPAEILSKIFDPFFTTKPVGKGTGLGLSVVYKIVKDLHKGDIQVKSELGKGAEFSLLIPLRISGGA